MKYISTRNNKVEFTFREVFIKGLADDGGLYVPKSLKRYSSQELLELKKLNYNQLSTEIINLFTGDFISKESRTTWFSWADNSAEYTACFCLSI